MRATARLPNANHISGLLDRAVAAHQAGEFDTADRLYRAALRREPENFDILHLLGYLSYQCGRPAEALRLLAAAVRQNPRSAEARSDLALALHALERYEEALAHHDAALALDPGNPDAVNRRAVTLLRHGRPEAALADLERALALAPGHVEALGNLGNTHVRLNRPLEAIAAYDAARRRAGDTAQLLTNRAHALRRLDRIDEAIADLEAALALAPDFAEAHFELALARLAAGDFAAGWDAYEWRHATAAFAPHRRSFTSPRLTGAEPLAGRTVLLHAEQGLGDTLQFVRYAPLLAQRGARVILETQPELETLLAGLSGVAAVVARGRKLPRFDLHCPLMSLPRAFATRLDTIPADIPYLAAAPERVQAWAARLRAGRPRIGIAWAGRPTHHNDVNRSIPLACLAPVLRESSAQFVSLQREPRPGDDAILRGLPNVLDLARELTDFADTAALVACLDAVVSVDTAVAHLAGALGRPLLVLLPYAADFRWLRGRDASPWYPTAHLVRQPAFGDWDGAIGRLAEWLGRLRPGHA